MNGWFLYLLLLGNIIGAVFGFTWWYGEQLKQAKWYLWIFTAPSPMYAALFVVAAILIMIRVKDSQATSFFYFITSIGLIKYGIWTIIFWLTFSGAKELGYLMIAWLVFSHGVMAAESSLLYHKIQLKKYSIPFLLMATAWFLLNDYLNYVGPTMMTKIAIPNWTIASSTAIVLTIISPFLAYFLAKRIRKPVLNLLK